MRQVVWAQPWQPWPATSPKWPENGAYRNEAVRKIKPEPLEDGRTVAALGQLLWKRGGKGPFSAVGLLYAGDDGETHRENIRARGGVGGFVGAHRDVFAMEAPLPGAKCPTIRLLTELERIVAKAERNKAIAEKTAQPCKFYRQGHCLRGSSCKFSHDEAPEVAFIQVDGKGVAERVSAIRSQVCYYLSDENLKSDAFFQGIIASSEGGWISLDTILGCRRMQQMAVTMEELAEALQELEGVQEGFTKLEFRAEPSDAQAVRRQDPPPTLEDRGNYQATVVPADGVDPSVSKRPVPELMKDLALGWKAVVEDFDRCSFCFVRRNTWPSELIAKEFELIRSSADWCELHSRREKSVTRSTAWYVSGGCCCRYVYGDVSVEGKERPDWLENIEARVFGELGLERKDWPNSVNMNLYENEDQNVGWHSDDEGLFRGCDRDCRIISASWGAPRNFEVALKDKKHASGRPSIFQESLRRIMLLPGDLLSMEGLFQKYYSHQLAKGASAFQKPPPARVRINLTWRYIVAHRPYCPLHCEG